MELTPENLTRAIKYISDEKMMRIHVFKNKPEVKMAKVAEMDYCLEIMSAVKEAIDRREKIRAQEKIKNILNLNKEKVE